jgi:hypothetical protein
MVTLGAIRLKSGLTHLGAKPKAAIAKNQERSLEPRTKIKTAPCVVFWISHFRHLKIDFRRVSCSAASIAVMKTA